MQLFETNFQIENDCLWIAAELFGLVNDRFENLKIEIVVLHYSNCITRTRSCKITVPKSGSWKAVQKMIGADLISIALVETSKNKVKIKLKTAILVVTWDPQVTTRSKLFDQTVDLLISLVDWKDNDEKWFEQPKLKNSLKFTDLTSEVLSNRKFDVGRKII